ncbi:uncharacterized protein LOC129748007 [Uranotaenia lowii]|uniref:uncharacterized protein LOC129748007 n=1 Tax=Uranotaenia lowii TaxID=190385 RepID=UPI00247AE18A|nr:uncharacterized protein LOC129748007 [Uranotaenia lowii]
MMKLIVVLSFILAVIALAKSNQLYKPDGPKVCGKLLRTPANVVEAFDIRQPADNPDTHCLVRCLGVINRYYDDETGPNWERIEEIHNGKPGLEDHRRDTSACIEAIQPEQYGDNYCHKSYLHFQCAMESYKKNIRKQE